MTYERIKTEQKQKILNERQKNYLNIENFRTSTLGQIITIMGVLIAVISEWNLYTTFYINLLTFLIATSIPFSSIVSEKFSKNFFNFSVLSEVILEMISLLSSNKSKNEKLYIAAGLLEGCGTVITCF